MSNKKFNFKEVADALLKNKSNYKKIDDESKEFNFFIINRKLSVNYPKQAQFFNNKNVDKASAMDIWFKFLQKEKINYIPHWWYVKSQGAKKKNKSNFTKSERELFMKYNSHINPRYLDFLFKYYEEDVKEELKIIKKIEKRNK